MPWQLYPQGKSAQYQLDRRLGEPKNQSGRESGEKSCPYRDSNSDPSAVQPIASPYTDSTNLTSHKFQVFGQKLLRLFESEREEVKELW
jgi:hypothetical protein